VKIMETNIGNYKFITFKESGAEFVFSTAEGKLDFHIEKLQGILSLEKIKDWFQVESVGYLKQIHSDEIYKYDGEIHLGDALITNNKGVAIGVFTADCVPVLLYDDENNSIAAVHSGWKGTLSEIVSKTIDAMNKTYKSRPENIVAYIGPHNRVCCYEVGEQLISDFKKHKLYRDIEISKGMNLDLEACIKAQLKSSGIKEVNIHTVGVCTYCNTDYKLHSYRKSAGESGRMFSFIILR
jgi:YfiH family protein